MGESVLVTGASGFIGRSLVMSLVDRGLEVIAVSRSEPPMGVHWIQWDLSEGALPPTLPAVEKVIHLAQSEFYRDFPTQALNIFNINTIITAKLLDYCVRHGVSQFVLASSGGVYGYGDSAFSETEVPVVGQELGYYLGTKHCAEILAECYCSEINVIVLRLFFVYGIGQRETMLIPRLLRSVIEGSPITLSGDNGISINPINVKDAVMSIESALNLKTSEKINIAGSNVVTLRALCELMGSILGRKPIFEHVNQDVRNLIGDTTKMARLIGRPSVTLEDGIADMIQRLVSTQRG